MMQGRVVYRDLFEQKGVLLYFLHGLAYLISHTTFIGVFAIEVAAGTAYLYYVAKTTALFVDEKWSYVIVPALAALVYSSDYFAHGDSAEELCLPMMMAGFYVLMRFFRGEGTLTARTLLVCGVLAGGMLWIKYTMLGWWLGFMIAVFVALLLRRQTKRALLACVWFSAGMAAATLPWVVYFAANGALGDWFNAYFRLNITFYAQTTGVVAMFWTVCKHFLANVLTDAVLLVLMPLGIAGFIGIRRMLPGFWAKLSLLLPPVLLVLGVYGGGRNYAYYFLAVAGMTILPGMIVLARALSAVAARLRRPSGAKPKERAVRRHVLTAAGCTAALVLSVWYAHGSYQYRSFMQEGTENLVQTQFAAIMNEEHSPTLLNYGFLDGGFYTAADILPTVKYFCRLNIPLPEMVMAQDAAVIDGAVRFVVTRSGVGDGDLSVAQALNEKYELAARADQEFEDLQFTYSLYKLKE